MSFATDFSPSDLKALFGRSRAVYGHKGAWVLRDESSEDAKAFRNEWWRILRNVSASEVEQAANLWLGGSKDEWPKPGQLYSLILDSRPKREEVKGKLQCRCGDPTCDLRLYQTDSGYPRLYMDCAARVQNLSRYEVDRDE